MTDVLISRAAAAEIADASWAAHASEQVRAIADAIRALPAAPPQESVGRVVATWQVCPKCNGQKHVNTPPHVAGDSPSYTTADNRTYPCGVCGALGVLRIAATLPQEPTK